MVWKKTTSSALTWFSVAFQLCHSVSKEWSFGSIRMYWFFDETWFYWFTLEWEDSRWLDWVLCWTECSLICSGPFFGFSSVLWSEQQRARWEGDVVNDDVGHWFIEANDIGAGPDETSRENNAQKNDEEWMGQRADKKIKKKQTKKTPTPEHTKQKQRERERENNEESIEIKQKIKRRKEQKRKKKRGRPIVFHRSLTTTRNGVLIPKNISDKALTRLKKKTKQNKQTNRARNKQNRPTQKKRRAQIDMAGHKTNKSRPFRTRKNAVGSRWKCARVSFNLFSLKKRNSPFFDRAKKKVERRETKTTKHSKTR